MKIGLFTGRLNNENMGCNALAYSAISLLKEASANCVDNLSFVIFTKENAKSLTLYPSLKNTNIHLVDIFLGFKGFLKGVLFRRLSEWSDFKKQLQSCDIVFEIGGGDSFSDIYGTKRIKSTSRLHQIAFNNGIPIVFLPQTIGPFRLEESQRIAQKLLRNSKKVFARDPLSFKLANETIQEPQLSHNIDMAFFMEYQQNNHMSDKPVIGINPSGLLWGGGYSGKNQFGLHVDYKQLLREILSTINPEEYKVVLLAHVLSGPRFTLEDDYKVCRQLADEFSHCSVAPFFYTPTEAKSFISGLDFLVASRMHACIAAYSTNVPVFPLAYSRKFKGLFLEELGYKWGAELTEDTNAEILTKFKNALSERKVIADELISQHAELLDYKTSLLKELKQLLFEAGDKIQNEI